MNTAGLYLIAILIWGSSWFVITFQIGVVHEAVAVFYRFLLAALLMLLYCVISKRRLRFSVKQHGFIALQGSFLFCLNYVLIYYGTAYISSGLVAVVFSTLAIWNIFNGAVFLKKPVQPLVLLGAMIGLTGIALVFGHEFVIAQNSAKPADIWTGLVLVLLAAYSASLGNIISARNQADGLPVLQTNAFGTLYGSLILFFYALVVGADFNIEWTVPFAISLVYLSVFGTIVAFGAYLSLIGKIGADKAAYAMVVFPVVALIISTAFEGFVWSPLALIGVGLVVVGNIAVIGGVHIVRWYRRTWGGVKGKLG